MNTNQSLPNFKWAAEGQLFFAKMARLSGNRDAAKAHLDLAEVYIKQELKKAVGR